MKMLQAAVIAVAVLMSGVPALAQKPAKKAAERPDFSGTWTLDADASGMQATGTLAAPLVVTHTPGKLVVERKGADGQPMTFTYRTDGSFSANQYTTASGHVVELKSMAKWDGQSLTITTPRGVGQPVVEAWSLKDNVLTIQVGTQTRIYKKKS
jgi:hypothetical protein